MSDTEAFFRSILFSAGCLGAGAFFVFIFLVVIAVPLSKKDAETKCQAYAELTGYEVKVIMEHRCMINDPDEGWMSYEARVEGVDR